MALRLKQVPAAQGVLWVRRGLAVFARKPLGFSSMLVAFFLLSLVASLVLPVVGGLLGFMAVPLLTLGAMMGSQAVLRGEEVHPGLLVQPLRQPGERRKALLKLCGLYGALMLLVSALALAAAGDDVSALLAAHSGPVDAQQAEAIARDPRLLRALLKLQLVWATLASLLSVPFWHAPPLVAWAGQGVAQALFSSTLAVWRCKGAFTMYALMWMGVLMLGGVLATVLSALLGAAALVVLTVVVAAAFYASLYFTFADSFELDPPLASA